MLHIYFLNVGQGDTIAIEWRKNDGQPGVGFIDCNKRTIRTGENKQSEGNPAVEFIRHRGHKQIDFIILSHPHYDHFSGLEQLFVHCIANRIHIEYFFHSSMLNKAVLDEALSKSSFLDNAVNASGRRDFRSFLNTWVNIALRGMLLWV